jgi:hypothetical protein
MLSSHLRQKARAGVVLGTTVETTQKWPMSCERDFFTLKGEKFTFSNNL